MAELVMGPLLRYVDETTAAIWVEVDQPCTVTALDAKSRTFTVHGHHYALVEIEGLEPASSTPYTVSLDGEQVWPEPDSEFPPSRIRTVDPHARVRLLFGSCRTSVPHDVKHLITHGVDVLRSYGFRVAGEAEEEWPTALLLLGDQVYADEPPEAVREFIRSRRDTTEPPGEEIADFTEYALMYQLAWVEPAVRWMLSTIPTAMIFDDHDLRDDWNTSHDWRQEMLAKAWWRRRVVAGLASYWIYQHLGNLPPNERAKDPLLAALRAADGDGAEIIDEFAWRADQEPTGNRWSYHRDYGKTRVIVLDSRCARDLTPGRRKMIDDVEWDWFSEVARGDHEHLIIGSSLPVLLPTGLHYLESWNEAVADGRWGRRAARVAEKIRQAVDLEHWGAFRDSFDALARVTVELATGRRGSPPATVLFLSGDVHYSYLAKARIRGASSKVYQVVCSPIRNPLSRLIRFTNVAASFGVAGLVGRLLARAANVRRTLFGWKLERGPWFQNALASLDLDGRSATLRFHTAKTSAEQPELITLGEESLT